MKHKSDRTEGKDDILEAAKEMAGYTLRITSNEKNFPKRYRLTVINKIQEKAFYIYDCLITAQEIYPNTKIEFERRLLYQKEARAACRSLMSMVEIAADTFGVDAGRFEHWTKMVSDLRSHTTGWIMADKARFKRFG